MLTTVVGRLCLDRHQPGDAEPPGTVALQQAEDEPGSRRGRVSSFAIRDGQVAVVYDIVNPDKISRAFSS